MFWRSTRQVEPTQIPSFAELTSSSFILYASDCWAQALTCNWAHAGPVRIGELHISLNFFTDVYIVEIFSVTERFKVYHYGIYVGHLLWNWNPENCSNPRLLAWQAIGQTSGCTNTYKYFETCSKLWNEN